VREAEALCPEVGTVLAVGLLSCAKTAGGGTVKPRGDGVVRLLVSSVGTLVAIGVVLALGEGVALPGAGSLTAGLGEGGAVPGLGDRVFRLVDWASGPAWRRKVGLGCARTESGCKLKVRCISND